MHNRWVNEITRNGNIMRKINIIHDEINEITSSIKESLKETYLDNNIISFKIS